MSSLVGGTPFPSRAGGRVLDLRLRPIRSPRLAANQDVLIEGGLCVS